MNQFHHIDVTNGNLLLKRFATASVVKHGGAAPGETAAPKHLLDLLFVGSAEDRTGYIDAQGTGGPT